MDIHSKWSWLKTYGERKKISFRAHGITSYHAAPAALMVAAGLAISAVVSDVPPTFNKAYAASMEEQVAQIGEYTTQLNASVAGILNIQASGALITEKEEQSAKDDKLNDMPLTFVTDPVPEVNYAPSLADDICALKKDEEKTDSYDFSSFRTSLTQNDAAQKLDEIDMAERLRELREAKGQIVASSNKKLYLDTYKYQRGSSNIPSTGLYTRCVPGQIISQLQMPESLTFDENGVPENYLYYIDGKATAYSSGRKTSTGSFVRPGVVAVDPRQIPYGTEMWIVSSDGKYVYGFARAEDTGGFIYFRNGATVDLYMNTVSDCYTWGFRGVRIYILPTSYK